VSSLDIPLSTEEQAFRDEFVEWLGEHLRGEFLTVRGRGGPDDDESWDVRRAWEQELAGGRWLGCTWPERYGGRGANLAMEVVFQLEYARAGAPARAAFHGETLLAPTLLAHGTEEQRAAILPRLARSEVVWCQGYSEPGSGSDLASLRTTAVRQGDRYIVNGQKIWTSGAHYADWIFCLVRTDSGAARRQEGISFLLFDMKTPGITVRPLMLMASGHHVNEVFFENVEVPAENLVFEEGKGWTVAKYLLGYERMNTGRIGTSKRELAQLKEFASRQPSGGRSLIDDLRFRDKVARVEVELMALEITSLRFLDRMQRTGQPPGADVSMLKIKGTEIQQALTELMMQAVGPLAQPFKSIGGAGDIDEFTARLAPRYCNFRKTTIYAGSNEIQRNIIAKMTLGL